MNKKIITYFIIAVFMTLLPSQIISADSSNNGKLTISSVSSVKNETVEVVVSLADNPGIWSMGVKITYNANALTLVSTTNGQIVAEDYVVATTSTSGSQYYLAKNRTLTNKTGNGKLLTLIFKVNNAAASGNYDIKANIVSGNTINVD